MIRTGSSDAAKALMGKTVSMIGGAMYTQYRTMKVRDVMELPAGTTPADGASWFVNPLTALGMTETMRRENHKALVHTAAASNLGQMLNKICIKDGIGLVNIVRSKEQADILHKIGAKHVVDSTADTFMDDLTNALVETGATIAFDAIGGGKLAGQILTCMEIAANKTAKEYSRYGSNVYKQVYIYGSLDNRPTELSRAFGLTWGVGGWLLTPFLQKIGPAEIGSCASASLPNSRPPLPAITRRWCRCRRRCSFPTSRSTTSAPPARNSSSTRARADGRLALSSSHEPNGPP